MASQKNVHFIFNLVLGCQLYRGSNPFQTLAQVQIYVPIPDHRCVLWYPLYAQSWLSKVFISTPSQCNAISQTASITISSSASHLEIAWGFEFAAIFVFHSFFFLFFLHLLIRTYHTVKYFQCRGYVQFSALWPLTQKWQSDVTLGSVSDSNGINQYKYGCKLYNTARGTRCLPQMYIYWNKSPSL